MSDYLEVRRCCILAILLGSCAARSNGQVTVSIDMDTNVPGVQGSRVASPGESFPIAMWLDVGASGLSSYGVSLLFDTIEFDLMGAGAASELLPAGFDFNLTDGVESLLEDIGGGLGRVSTFEAATFGAGPIDSTFIIGTIDFLVDAIADDGLVDLTPGLFNAGIDGFFSNAGTPILPVFHPGHVVPEPISLTLLALGAVLIVGRQAAVRTP